MAYLMWRDPSSKAPADKLADAIAAYVDRNGRPPAECLTNPRDATALETAPGAMQCGEKHEIAAHTFYVGDNS